MKSNHINQSISEQTFHLFNRPVHPELFEIHESCQFKQGDYEAQIWITGTSHVVSLFCESKCITELISPPDQMLPVRGLIKDFQLSENKNYKYAWPDGMQYMLNSSVETMSVNVFKQTQLDLIKKSNNGGMFAQFPQWNNGEFTPITFLDFEARQDSLNVSAWHTFPEQLSILKTQSILKPQIV
jgi:hypothetical protein